MNLIQKTTSKILGNGTLQGIQIMTINHNKVRYISGMQASFNIKYFIKTSHSINRLKKQLYNHLSKCRGIFHTFNYDKIY